MAQKKSRNILIGIKIVRAILQILMGIALEIATGFIAKRFANSDSKLVPLAAVVILIIIVGVIYYFKKSISQYDNDVSGIWLYFLIFAAPALMTNLVAEFLDLNEMPISKGLQVGIVVGLLLFGFVCLGLDTVLDKQQDVYEIEGRDKKNSEGIDNKTEIDLEKQKKNIRAIAWSICVLIAISAIILTVLYWLEVIGR